MKYNFPVVIYDKYFLVTLTIINCYDTRAAASVQVFFTAANLIALFIIVIGGLVRLGQGKTCNLKQAAFTFNRNILNIK